MISCWSAPPSVPGKLGFLRPTLHERQQCAHHRRSASWSGTAVAAEQHARGSIRRIGRSSELIGYDQTYISALEVGLKGPPTPEFVDKLVEGLALSRTEEAALRSAAEVSDRKLVLDADSHPEIYLMLAALKRRLRELHPAQARMIRVPPASPVGCLI